MRMVNTLVAGLSLVTLAGATQAALIDRGGGMIYDTTLDITWLADWNYAFTSGYAAANAGGSGANQILANGRMGWAAANEWADTLNHGGFNDWRLPTSLNADGSGPCGPGFNCGGSEMGHMFYNNWEAIAGSAFSSGTNAAALALFSNVLPFYYWSGTAYALGPNQAWFFATLDGYQDYANQGSPTYAVAVRPGDVGLAVPEPQTLALALLALSATALARRRKRHPRA